MDHTTQAAVTQAVMIAQLHAVNDTAHSSAQPIEAEAGDPTQLATKWMSQRPVRPSGSKTTPYTGQNSLHRSTRLYGPIVCIDPLTEQQRYVIIKVSKLFNESKSSADAEGPRDAPQIRNIALEKACNRGITFKQWRIYHWATGHAPLPFELQKMSHMAKIQPQRSRPNYFACFYIISSPGRQVHPEPATKSKGKRGPSIVDIDTGLVTCNANPREYLPR